MDLDKKVLFDYILHLADNSMILGQRNAEWCGHGPVLEQDIALTNITLDLIGEARSLYAYAAEIKGENNTEDTIAFLRDILDYRNVLLVEQKNEDWAHTIIRQFLFDTYHFYLLQALSKSKDETLVSIARKSLKEASYHLKWSSEWTIRLGDGTELSRSKMQSALNNLWEFSGEMLITSETEIAVFKSGIGADLQQISFDWKNKVEEILKEATLEIPASTYMQKGGKTGYHGEHLGYVLAEMQYLQRAYPGVEW